MKEIHEKFAVIEDWRHQGYVEHKLSDVLLMVTCAVMCGMTELADMMVYFSNKLAFFKGHFGIEKYPSKPTLSRILNLLDGEKVVPLIVDIMKQHVGEMGEFLAVDGKTIRSTSKKGKKHSALQILTAYLIESGVVLGQKEIAYGDKTNEIPVFQEMLGHLDIKGKTITADAMHCQKGTCEKIIEGGGDYVFGVKGNQKTLLEDVALYFGEDAIKEEISTFGTLEKNGGRIEKRVCSSSQNVGWLTNKEEWVGVASIFSVKRTVTAAGTTTEETSHYISSRKASAEGLLAATRGHWKIESMHWMLDVVWKEDESGILSDNGHKTLNILSKPALLAHKRYVAKQTKKQSVKGNVLQALLNDDVLIGVLNNL